MQVFHLEDHRSLFKDDKAYQEFLSKLRIMFTHDMGMLAANGQIIGSTISPDFVEKVMRDEVFRRGPDSG